VQREGAVVEAQELRVAQGGAKLPGRCRRLLRPATGQRDCKPHDGDGRQREHAGHHEDAGHADPSLEDRAHDHRDREGRADGDADGRHRGGAHGIAREIGGERDDGRRDGAGALQAASDDDPADAGVGGGNEAAYRE
jgi:hypothetical protein